MLVVGSDRRRRRRPWMMIEGRIGVWFELLSLTRSVDLSLAIEELVLKMADSFGGRDIFIIGTPCKMERELHVASIWRET